MNVSIEKTGNVSAILTVSIEENDYKEKVTKELKEIGKKQDRKSTRLNSSHS